MPAVHEITHNNGVRIPQLGLGTFKVRQGSAAEVSLSALEAGYRHLDRLAQECAVLPAVNQIEVHPYLTQDALRGVNSSRCITTEAWSPIGLGRVFSGAVIDSIAREVQRTPAQLTLRCAVQRGDIAFPKSAHPDRMRENLELIDFALCAKQMAAFTSLERGERTGPDPDDFNWVL